MRSKSGLLSVNVLRECFRHLWAWRAVYETDGVDVITTPDGQEICLWDLEYLYSQIDKLPLRQRQAIEVFLVGNQKEEDVAQMMGIAPSNPIGVYATAGLNRLISMIQSGALERFQEHHQSLEWRRNGDGTAGRPQTLGGRGRQADQRVLEGSHQAQ